MSSNEWASQRKFSILFSIFFLIIVIVSIPVYFTYFNTKPTCGDNKQNGTESGIDCGGICLQICPSAAQTPIIHFARAFRVENGTYNVVAFIENVNPTYIGLNAAYSFKLYDKDNILVAERDGVTTLLPHKLFPVFEAGVDAGNKIPTKVVFQFQETTHWQRSQYIEPLLQIENQFLSTTSAPRLDADLQNQTLESISKVEATALLSDTNGNVIASSRTFVESLAPNGTAHLIFTWPKSFSEDIAQIQILTQVLPNDVQK